MRKKMKILIVLLSASVGVVSGVCRSHEFSCDRTRCLPRSWLCDADPDCADGTDEMADNCPGSSEDALGRECRSTEFRCGNGNCIPSTWRCDGQDDCRDNTDETTEDCIKCQSGEFQCVSDKQCITGLWQCNGQADCDDGSDEENCPTRSTPTLPKHMFRCKNGITIPRRWVCDGEEDCTDGGDELVCNVTKLSPSRTVSGRNCRDNEFACGSYCIMGSWLCDGGVDCPNGEDEANCKNCSSSEFTCANKQCILGHLRCNGNRDCEDGSDEANCSSSPPVPEDSADQCNLTTHFMCQEKCIHRRSLCNGQNDCGDWQDESEEVCGVNECERNNGGCTQSCVDTKESYYCQCEDGYRLNGKYTCEDIDECLEIPGICSQQCNNTIGNYHCSCFSGYERDPGNFTRCKVSSGDPFLLFTNRYDIRSLRLRDGDMKSVVGDARGATGLDYLYSSHQIVWSDKKENKIMRAHMFTPEGQEVLVTGDKVSADGLAVDWIHKNIYYTETSNFKIHMVSWDARWSKTIANEELGQPRAIVVSPIDGYIFWTDWGNPPKIERAGLDGATRTAIITSPHLYWPNGITIDYTDSSTKHLYWCDGKLNTISMSDLDGSQIKVILFSSAVLRLPFSLTVFEDRLFWTDWSQLAIHSANKFTGEDIQKVSAGHLLESPKVVHVYHKNRQLEGENVCTSHTCSHFCVRSVLGIPLCVCPDNMVLSTEDYATCVTYDTTDLPPAVTSIEHKSDTPSVKDHSIIVTMSPVSSDGTQSSSSKGAPTPVSSDEAPRPLSIPTSVSLDGTQSSSLIGSTENPFERPPVNTSPQVGMILGVALGFTVVLALAVVMFVGWWKVRRGVILHSRFPNPVYRKTTDEEMDGGGYILSQDELLYNPRDYHCTERPETPLIDDDDVPLAPKK
ncbi:low-density lipoprotein receptor-like [Panulirus ornatus]|uniref:low-density lipoprotein receptor-like n=1 Tax=Panulirus ornatus TaxID=150431 RepID=UPI003A87FE2A